MISAARKITKLLAQKNIPNFLRPYATFWFLVGQPPVPDFFVSQSWQSLCLRVFFFLGRPNLGFEAGGAQERKKKPETLHYFVHVIRKVHTTIRKKKEKKMWVYNITPKKCVACTQDGCFVGERGWWKVFFILPRMMRFFGGSVNEEQAGSGRMKL